MSLAFQQQFWVRAGSLGAVTLFLAFAFLGGCGQTVEVGNDDPLTSGGSVSGASSAGTGGLELGGVSSSGTAGDQANGGSAEACVVTLCRGKPYQCGNCMDDDGDGLVDALDPDCLGPCDDDELGLSTGLGTVQSAACRQDCYFDGDAGPGNDKCEWSHACDPLSVAPDYPPSGESRCRFGSSMGVDCAAAEAAQPQACLDSCLPVVPNGCDCFGCCELPGGSGNYHYIGVGRGAAGCQRDTLNDAKACPPCTPVPSCFNDCAKCETCVDRAPDPSCSPSGACPAGGRPCGAEAPCDTGDYCVTGCCVRAPEPI